MFFLALAAIRERCRLPRDPWHLLAIIASMTAIAVAIRGRGNRPPPPGPGVHGAGDRLSRTGAVGSRQQAARAVEVGRNAPCPCGSGKKFKKCCGRPGGPSDRATDAGHG